VPNGVGAEPSFLVPSHTTALHVAVSADKPVYFDFSWMLGDPDIGYVADSSIFDASVLGAAGGLPLGGDVAAFPYTYTIGG
jgi:hypothetical protein